MRVSFATALAAGRLPLDHVPEVAQAAGMEPAPRPSEPPAAQFPPADAAALANLLGPTLSAKSRAAIDASEPQLRAALLLGGPDFMRR
jgi:hypothetical protein